jgi:glycerophosphoryl diester phosphodiesterase
MAAFKGAVKVGAHAIETDIHLTKDDIVVLSHVRTLYNLLCFVLWFILKYYRILH